ERACSIHLESRTGDVSRSRRKQEGDRRGNLALGTQPQRGRLGSDTSYLFLNGYGIGLETAGVNDAGCKGVHAYAIDRPFESQALGQIDDTGTRRAGVRHTGKATPHLGHDIDDRSAMLTHTGIQGSA